MKFYIVIPVHNEQETIGQTLESLVRQSILPKKIVVVNDNSTDKTAEILAAFSEKYDWIEAIHISSSEEHLPGAKVIKAFYQGLTNLDEDYDIICKFDADIIFPTNYLEVLAHLFNSNPKIGIAGGIPFIYKNDKWVFENIASKDHVRGPIKSYRKDCFKDIKGLKRSAGWDSVDVLLAQYYGWKVVTDKELHVKHLKPTGSSYHGGSKYLRGEALYKMRMGPVLSTIASLKSAFKKGSFNYFMNSIRGFFMAKRKKSEFIVDEAQGKFIRQLHWQNIYKKLKMN